jgi:hypothetical protein
MEQANPKFEKVLFVCGTTLGVVLYGAQFLGMNDAKWLVWALLLLCTIVFVAVSKIAWRIGDWFRRFTMPSAYFSAGSWDMFWKRLGYMVGPQLVALAIAWVIVYLGVFLSFVAVGLIKK